MAHVGFYIKAQCCQSPAHPYAPGRARIILSRKWKLCKVIIQTDDPLREERCP